MKFIRPVLAICLLIMAFLPLDLTKEESKSIISCEPNIVIPSEVIVLPESRPELIIEVPQEISIIEDEPPAKKLTAFINPNKVPVTQPPWNYKIRGGETVSNMTEHLYLEHNVEKHLVIGWNLTQLRRLHAYCHNGFSLEDLYEYF